MSSKGRLKHTNGKINWTNWINKKTHKITYGAMFVDDKNSTGGNQMC